MRLRHVSLAAILGVLASGAYGRPGYALDPFEIQVYDPEINDPGRFGLELHSIYYATGHEATNGTELPLNHQLHETLEASLGLGRHLELGAYLQTALRADGVFDFAGAKIRLKWRIPVPVAFPLQFAVNFELSNVPSSFDAGVWGGEIRPVVQWHPGHAVVSVNPILSFAWTGPYTAVPVFEPCVSFRYEIADILAPGIEYFASVGPVTSVDPWASQGQYLVETVDVVAFPDWELHAGLGEGLNAASQGVLVNVIAGHTF